MRAFLGIAIVVVVTTALIVSCQNDQPTNAEKQSVEITGPELSIQSGTTYACSTGIEFLNAQAAYSPGDTIKLLVSDPGPLDLFMLIRGISPNAPFDELTLIGCDTEPSIIAVDYFEVTSIYSENSTIENVTFLWGQSMAGTINIQGTTGRWDGVHIAPYYAYPPGIHFLGDASGSDYSFVDCVNLDPTVISCGPFDTDLTIDGCELTDGNVACDPADIPSSCNVALESWKLNGKTYSFETLPTITDLTLIGFTLSRGGCKAGVKFKVNWNGFPDNAGIAGVYIDHGDNACTTEKAATKFGDWYKATFLVNYADCDFRWRARVVLCGDSGVSPTVTSACRLEDVVCGICY
jgi:hypothetical protein